MAPKHLPSRWRKILLVHVHDAITDGIVIAAIINDSAVWIALVASRNLIGLTLRGAATVATVATVAIVATVVTVATLNILVTDAVAIGVDPVAPPPP